MGKTLKSILLASCLITSAGVFAKEDTEQRKGSSFQDTKTVFMDIGAMNRRKGAAKKLSKLYAEEARDGWRVIDLELYIEDSDLEGFFITFARNTLR
jgi:hypothetical protein